MDREKFIGANNRLLDLLKQREKRSYVYFFSQELSVFEKIHDELVDFKDGDFDAFFRETLFERYRVFFDGFIYPILKSFSDDNRSLSSLSNAINSLRIGFELDSPMDKMLDSLSCIILDYKDSRNPPEEGEFGSIQRY